MFEQIIREVATRFGLGDKAGPLVQMLVSYMGNNQTGGLAGFIGKFEQAGLGALAKSWLGGSANAQSISTSQVEQVLGGSGGLLSSITSKLGLGGPVASSVMTYLLPLVVGKLTPGGSIPTSLPAAATGFINSALGHGSAAVSGAVDAAADSAKSAGSGLMKWLPWLLAALAAIFLWNSCSGPSGDAKKAAEAVKGAGTAVADAAKGAAAGTVDAAKTAATAAGAATGAAADAAKSAAGGAVDAAKSATAAAGAAAGAAVEAVKEAIPAGAGNLFSIVNGVPTLKVYFDTGKTDVAPDFAAKAKAVVDYMKANGGAKAVVTGFNDPTGNAAANAELSKNRAKAVAAALKAAGVNEADVVLEKPADTVPAGMTNAEMRRVEVTVRK